MSSLLHQPHSMTYNPWNVDSIHAFYFLNCPECIFSTKDEYCFQDHALQKHPLSFALFGQVKVKNEVLETNLGDNAVDNDQENYSNFPLPIPEPEASMKVGKSIKQKYQVSGIKEELPDHNDEDHHDVPPDDNDLDDRDDNNPPDSPIHENLDDDETSFQYKFDVEPKKEEIIVGKYLGFF